ncbi:MAG: hypothetical protein FD156_198 [Nitrospirae bacterium]|nr:MAG: hypothetical protein FD156_198 [Nitrospirota bacterium]
MEKKNDKSSAAEIELADAYIVAVFAFENSRDPNNKPFEIQPYLKAQNEVAWRISGKGILHVLEKISGDNLIPINSYIKSLKEIRSSIFLYKQFGRGRYE